jgi:hypothetical protein
MFEGVLINKENITKPEKAKKLENFCANHGNSIKYVDCGRDFELGKMDESRSVTRKNCLIVLRNYLRGPIFTDSFSKNHVDRREWEQDSKKTMKEEDDEKIEVIKKFGKVVERIISLLENKGE